MKKDPQHSQHHPTSLSSDTCRCLSPTTGPLPTVHCWQSTMHCPNSAKWGKSLFVVYMYTWDQGKRRRGVFCPLKCDVLFHVNQLDYIIIFLKPSEVESKEEATSMMFFFHMDLEWDNSWDDFPAEGSRCQSDFGVSCVCSVFCFFLEGVHCWISTMALASLVVWYLFHSLC